LARSRVLQKIGPDLVAHIHATLGSKKLVLPIEEDGWISASALPRLCARAEVLAARHDFERSDVIEYYSQLTFDFGKGLHWAMQNHVLPELGCLVGEWRCTYCGATHGGGGENIERPSVCAVSGCCPPSGGHGDDTVFEYVEQYFRDDDYRVKGHPDGFLTFDSQPGLGILELKSISERGFKDVRDVPDIGHVIQLQTYFWLTGLTWGVIVYWNKAAWKAPMLQHFVERDEDTISSIKEMVQSIRDGVAQREDPHFPLPERICNSSDCRRAEECSLVKLCFPTVEST